VDPTANAANAARIKTLTVQNVVVSVVAVVATNVSVKRRKKNDKTKAQALSLRKTVYLLF
jgi:hypothetical protein